MLHAVRELHRQHRAGRASRAACSARCRRPPASRSGSRRRSRRCRPSAGRDSGGRRNGCRHGSCGHGGGGGKPRILPDGAASRRPDHRSGGRRVRTHATHRAWPPRLDTAAARRASLRHGQAAPHPLPFPRLADAGRAGFAPPAASSMAWARNCRRRARSSSPRRISRPRPTHVGAAAQPHTVHDFGGFPPPLYADALPGARRSGAGRSDPRRASTRPACTARVRTRTRPRPRRLGAVAAHVSAGRHPGGAALGGSARRCRGRTSRSAARLRRLARRRRARDRLGRFRAQPRRPGLAAPRRRRSRRGPPISPTGCANASGSHDLDALARLAGPGAAREARAPHRRTPDAAVRRPRRRRARRRRCAICTSRTSSVRWRWTRSPSNDLSARRDCGHRARSRTPAYAHVRPALRSPRQRRHPVPASVPPAGPGLRDAAQPHPDGLDAHGPGGSARAISQARRLFRRARRRRRGPDRHRRLRAERGRLAETLRAASCRGATKCARIGRSRKPCTRTARTICLQIAACRALRLPPACRSRRRSSRRRSIRSRRARCRRAASNARSMRTSRAATFAREAGYDGVELMGSEGYLINQFTVARTNKRTDAWGGDVGATHALRRWKSSAACAKPAARTSSSSIACRCSTSSKAARDWHDIVQQAQGRSRPRARRSSTPASAGTKRASRRSPPPCRARRSPASPRSCARTCACRWSPPIASTCPTSPKRVLADGGADMVSMARPLLADPQWAEQGARRPRATRSTPASRCNQACLDHVFENKRASCLVNPRACARNRTRRYAPPRRRGASPSSAPAPRAWRARPKRPRAATRVDAVRCGRRDRRAVQPRQAHSRQGRVPRDAALLPRIASKRPASTLRLGTRVDAAMLDGLRRSRARHRRAAARGATSPASTHPKVVGYVDVLEGRVTCGPTRRDHRRGRHRLRRRRIPRARRPVADARSASAGCTNGASIRRSKRAAASQPARPNRRRAKCGCCSARAGKPGARLGKTTGWIHRATLKAKGVHMLGGVEYLGVDDDGLRIRIDGAEQAAAGRPRRDLRRAGTAPRAARCAVAGRRNVHVIGGADVAAELDAKRAIAQGTAASQRSL